MREDSDDQSRWLGQLLTSGECYEIHEDKSPVTLKFLLGRPEEGGRLRNGNSKRLKSAMAPAWHSRLPRAPYGGLLPGLFPSSQVGTAYAEKNITPRPVIR